MDSIRSRFLGTPWSFILCVCTIGKEMPALLYGDQEIHLGIETHLRNNRRYLFLKNIFCRTFIAKEEALDLWCFLFKVALFFPIPSLKPVDSPSCSENPQVDISSKSYFIFVTFRIQMRVFYLYLHIAYISATKIFIWIDKDLSAFRHPTYI